MALINCPQVYGNTGSPCPSDVDKGAIIGIIPTAAGFSFPTKAAFIGSDEYETAIKAGLIYPMMDITAEENVSDEDRRETFPMGGEILLGHAPYKFTFNFHLTEDQHKVLFPTKFSAYYKVYSNNYIDGWSEDGEIIKPITLGSWQVGKFIPGTSAPASSYTQIRVVEKNPREFNLYPMVGYPDWELPSLKGLTNVTLEALGTPTATEIIVDVSYIKTAMANSSGANPAVPITPIPIADFAFLDAVPAAQTPDSMTDNLDGTYTFVFTALVTGTVNLVTPPNMTNAFLIKSTGAAAFTV